MIAAAARAIDVSDLVTGSTISGSDVVLAIVTMVIAWILSRLARRGVVGVLGKVQGVSPDLRALAGRLTHYFVLLLGFGVALTFLGAAIQPFISAAIIIAVVAALALRGVADNFAAGVVIQTRRPMQLGDRIEALSHLGVVREMNGRSVVIETDDGRAVHLPNAKVLNNPLVNISANSAHRSELQVRSQGVDDIDGTIDRIVAAATSAHGVLGDPAPVALVTSIDHESVTMLVRIWHDPDAGSSAVSTAIRLIHAAEQQHGRATTVFSAATPAPGSQRHD